MRVDQRLLRWFVCLGCTLLGLHPVSALPNTPLQQTAVNQLFHYPYYVSYQGPTVGKSGSVSNNYEEKSTTLIFDYHIENRDFFWLTTSTKKPEIWPCRARARTPSIFVHPTLGKLFLCTKKNTVTNVKTDYRLYDIDIYSLRPFSGLYFKGNYQGKLDTIDKYLNQMMLTPSIHKETTPYSTAKETHLAFYQNLYRAEKASAFEEQNYGLRSVRVDWFFNTYPAMHYFFKPFSKTIPKTKAAGVSFRKEITIDYYNVDARGKSKCPSAYRIMTYNILYTAPYSLCVGIENHPIQSKSQGTRSVEKLFHLKLDNIKDRKPESIVNMRVEQHEVEPLLNILREKQMLY